MSSNVTPLLCFLEGVVVHTHLQLSRIRIYIHFRQSNTHYIINEFICFFRQRGSRALLTWTLIFFFKGISLVHYFLKPFIEMFRTEDLLAPEIDHVQIVLVKDWSFVLCDYSQIILTLFKVPFMLHIDFDIFNFIKFNDVIGRMGKLKCILIRY